MLQPLTSAGAQLPAPPRHPPLASGCYYLITGMSRAGIGHGAKLDVKFGCFSSVQAFAQLTQLAASQEIHFDIPRTAGYALAWQVLRRPPDLQALAGQLTARMEQQMQVSARWVWAYACMCSAGPDASCMLHRLPRGCLMRVI
jgi:hypothetical protein